VGGQSTLMTSGAVVFLQAFSIGWRA